MSARVVAPDFTPGSVWLTGAGPGDPGLLTLNAVHALEVADVILHDALIAPEILALSRPAARLEPVGKRAGRPGTQQLRINQRLIELAGAGLRVVRLKGGDPFVFGRGGEEALALAAAGVRFRIVPGVTAGIGAPAYAGIPATHRMRAQSVALVTGHNAGGGAPRAVDWPALARGAETIVLYMGLQRLPEVAAELLAAGRAPEEAVAILSEATTPRARQRITTLAAAAISESERQGPTLIVIGQVVGLSAILAPWQQTRPASIAGAPADRSAARL